MFVLFADRSLRPIATIGDTLLIAVALLTSLCIGQSNRNSTAEPLTDARIVARVGKSLDGACRHLAAQQSASGGWDQNDAINALAMLALMGRGHSPGRGPYRSVLERGRRFMLSHQRDDGLFASPRPSHGPMYEHALVTLATAEMYGMDPHPEVENKLRKAVDTIVQSQSSTGGWRYQPRPGDQDLSVTVMQIVALRAAQNCEIKVPEQTLEKAVEYVKSCYFREGGFGYQRGHQRNPQMTAAGILSLQLLGMPKDPTIGTSLDFLSSMPVEWKRNDTEYFFYFHYYAMQAQYQAGGKHWNAWHPRVREMFLDHQNDDGSWSCPDNTAESNPAVVGPNRVYWTAMSSLVLEVYLHFLPAYQR